MILNSLCVREPFIKWKNLKTFKYKVIGKFLSVGFPTLRDMSVLFCVGFPTLRDMSVLSSVGFPTLRDMSVLSCVGFPTLSGFEWSFLCWFLKDFFTWLLWTTSKHTIILYIKRTYLTSGKGGTMCTLYKEPQGTEVSEKRHRHISEDNENFINPYFYELFLFLANKI